MTVYDAHHWVRQGAKIRSVANDIKRNGEALAEEIGVDLETVLGAFEGAAGPEVYEQIINRMVEAYPVSRLDLEIRRDDTHDGVVVQTAQASLATSRVFSRADRSGQILPYYEYRDAAMSSVGPYRPEWIKELRTVESDDPLDLDISYNSGHLMHQATFFVGPVNFYWKKDGLAFMEKMETGDSNYITPFVPHSFASRDSSRDAYIVAVTFTGKLDSIHQDIMVLDPEGVGESLLDLSDPVLAFAGMLRREMANNMLGLEHLGERTGIQTTRLLSFQDGSALPGPEEMSALAEALGVNVRDLTPPEALDSQEVVVQHRSPDKNWLFPSEEIPNYEVQDLAGTRKTPLLRGRSVRVLDASVPVTPSSLDLATNFHEFGYNYGSVAAKLTWQGNHGVRHAEVEPGGSYYIKPTVPHALRSNTKSEEPELAVMRVGGALHGDGHLELSSYPSRALGRVLRETQQWYNPTKIGG
jgi:methylphosphonate synthase